MAGKRTILSNIDLPKGVVTRNGPTGTLYYLESKRDENGKRHLIALGQDRRLAIVTAINIKENRPKPPFDNNEMLRRVKKNARQRNIEFNLTLEDIDILFERSGGCCEISGISFDYTKIEGLRARPWIPSVDRKDSNGAYVFDNCRLVCSYVNMALNEFGLDALLFVAQNIRRRAPKKNT